MPARRGSTAFIHNIRCTYTAVSMLLCCCNRDLNKLQDCYCKDVEVPDIWLLCSECVGIKSYV
jgi:hypothetical protein